MAEVSELHPPVHAKWTSAETRAQFLAITELRWRIFRNSLFRRGGKGDLVANFVLFPVFLAVILGPTVGLTFLAYIAVAKHHPEFIAIALWAIFAVCQFTSIQLGQPGTTFDPTQLIRFPLGFSGYAAVRTFFGFISPATIVGVLMSFGVALGLTIADTSLATYAFPALAIYAIANIFFTRMLFSWIDRWLSTRRAREIFTGLIFTFSIGIQYLNATFNPGFQHGHKNAAAAAARLATMQHYYGIAKPFLGLLPPGLTANAVTDAQQGHVAAFAGGVLGTLAFALLFFAVFAMRLYKEFRGENLSEVANAVSTTHVTRPHTSAVASTSAPTVNRFAPPPTISAVFGKEFLTMRRNTGMFYGMVAPLAMVIIFAGKLASHAPASILFPAAVAYTMLGIAPLSYNSLGFEAAGIQFYFLAPVRMRDVFIAKNLMNAVLALVEIVAVFAVILFVSHPPTLSMTLSVFLWATFTLFVSMAVGNRRSVTAPKRLDPAKPAGKQASPLSVLLGIGLLLVCGGLGAGAILLGLYFGMDWFLLPSMLALAVIGFFIYQASLNSMDKLLAERRDTLSEILCKAG